MAGFVPGSILRLSVSDDAGITFETIFHVQSGTLSFTKNTNEIITKDTGGGTGFSEFTTGTKSGTLTGNGLVRFDPVSGTNANVSELFALYTNDTLFDYEWSTQVASEPVWTGKALLTDLSMTGEADVESTFDFTAQLSGDQTEGVVS